MAETKYPIFEQMRRRLRGEDARPFEHHKDFKIMIAEFNAFLARDVTKIERLFEYKITRDKSLEENVSAFTKFIALQIFGAKYPQVISDYNSKLRPLLTRSGVSEKIMRRYYFSLLAHKIKINYKDCTTNLEVLVPDIIKLTDYVFMRLVATDDKSFVISSSGLDEIRFLRAMLFFSLITMIAGIALNLLKEELGENYKHYVNLITKIYYGQSLSYKQYEVLKNRGLLFGIVYRGLGFKNLTSLLSALNTKNPGTSWSARYMPAIEFASWPNRQLQEIFTHPEHYLIASIADFKQKSSALQVFGRLSVFIDDPDLAVKILHDSLFRQNDIQLCAGVVLSYPVFKDNWFFASGESNTSIFEREIIINPKFFKPSRFSMDIALYLIKQS